MRALILAALLSPSLAYASGGWNIRLPKHDVGIGPSLAYVYADDHASSWNLDISYSYKLFTSSLNLKQISVNDEVYRGAQAEFTFWMALNVGGGAGYLFNGEKSGPIGHIFAGFPMGDDIFSKAFEPLQSGYIEPYARFNLFYSEGASRFWPEAGLLVKVSTYSI